MARGSARATIAVDPISDNTVGIVAIISIFVFFPIAISLARLIWRRTSSTEVRRPALTDDTARRLVEMQQTLDTMALEIERISEGQRFVTKLMSERPVAELAPPRK
jgi:hypothetical protein